MLTEDQVIEFLSKHLQRNGYQIEKICHTNKRGVDVVAKRLSDGRFLRVEAKGSTSAKSHTNRYGKPFDNRQIISVVSRAFYTACALRCNHADGDSAIALPDYHDYVMRIGKIAGACRDLGIGVFLVSDDGSVRMLTNV